MSDDNDLRSVLPDPPPASPSRRENAIEEAMRRFDGKPPSPSPKPARPDRAGWIKRPQLGALVTIGLMAVIGVPAAWLAIEPHHSEEQASRAPTTRNFATAPQAAAPKLEAADASPTEQVPAVGDRPSALAAVAVATKPPAAAKSMAEDKAIGQDQVRSDDRYASLRAVPVVQPPPTVSAPVAAALAVPPPPPPPPPVALADAAPSPPLLARARVADSIMVTGSRVSKRSVERGDWNACTVDDPKRDIAICSQSLGASGPGPDGTATAHLADGVSRAWRGDWDGAIQSFDAVIAIAPESGDAYLNRSLAYARLGDEERAFGDANKAVRHARDKARALYNRSVLLRRQGKIAEAQRDEHRTVTLDPSYAAVIPK
jgi:hypothetical protein